MANARTKNAAARIKQKLNQKFETVQPTPRAGAVGGSKLFISGQLFEGGITGVAPVVNVGRPAAATYAPKNGAGITINTVSSSSGGGGVTPPAVEPPRQYATLVIAASDSTADGIANPDYVCTGTADEVIIAAALAATTPSGERRVLLLEGTYTVTAGVTIPADCVIEGQGTSTVVKIASSGASATMNVFTLSDQSKVANLKIDGNGSSGNKTGIYATGKTGVEVTGVLVIDMPLYGIGLDACNHARIIGNRANDCSSMGIRVSGGTSSAIVGNTCYGNQFGIYLGYSSGEGIHHTVSGNTCRRNTYGIYLGSAFYNIVTGNTCVGIVGDLGDYGIVLDSAEYNLIDGNEMAGNDAAGMFVSYSNHNTIANNYIIGNSWSTSTSTGVNATAGIEIEDSINNFVHGNKIVKSLSGASEIQQYSIRVYSTACIDNVIIDNDLRNGGNTGYLNAGAGTIYRTHDGGTPMRTLTIATGVVSVAGAGYYALLPQTGTADDLDTINGVADGMVIYFRNSSATNTITLKHGTGNLDLQGFDVVLNAINVVQPLIYDAAQTKWLAISL